MAKHPNRVNYVIKRVNQKRSKAFLIHKNRLKKYFVESHVPNPTTKKSKTKNKQLKILETIDESGEEDLGQQVV
ncbi:hypothetical protein BpHYR1_021569 [Brachionus plicatilis]|uniref:Uncharacterized protein n=1 Tax=Brachionus plicatilis TaxID=10195 RepID=A0A3M7S738_BRAPC|nr:hypothetical protein BpHYR1_021569 [Brachionus plicatilis]